MADSLSKKIQLDKRKQVKPEDYCREIEAYLCRKNDGHLIRIVGPSFNLVCGWALRGVPMSVACQGIDRYFERYYAGTRRRRPVRIDANMTCFKFLMNGKKLSVFGRMPWTVSKLLIKGINQVFHCEHTSIELLCV